MEDVDKTNTKFHYFGGNGRGLTTRAILHYKKIDFEDMRYSFEDWGKVKKSGIFELEQLPMLEFRGKRLIQSVAINLYLARLFNLLGFTAEDEYYIISLNAIYEDMIVQLSPIIFPRTPEQIENLQKNIDEFVEKSAPFYLKKIENRFVEHGKGFLVGDTFSLADISTTVFLHHVFKQSSRKDFFEPVLNEHAPTLAAHIEKIAQNELADFYAKGYIHESSF